MTDPAETRRIVAGPEDGLPEVLQALRATIGDRVILVIPPGSGLFMTAGEFRALKTTGEQVGVTISVETDDRLRRQLAQMFTVEWQPLPVVEAPPRIPSAWPAAPTDLPDAASGAVETVEVVDPLELKTSKPWRAEVIDASRETALPPPPSMTPEIVDDIKGLPMVEAGGHRGRMAARRRALAAVGALLVAALLLGLVGSIWLRSATVRVTLKRQPVASEVRFGVRAVGVDQIDGAAFMVDASPVDVEATFTTTVPVTGTITEQTAPATGAIQLRNIGDEAVTIPAGTVVAVRGGPTYRTVAEAELEAGSTRRPSQGEVQVESVTGGDTANMEPGMLVGPLEGFEGVYFANLEAPLAGGEGRRATGVSADDEEAIVALARAELDKQATATTLPGGGQVVPSSLVPEGDVAYTLDHAVGEPAETLTIEARLAYVALAVDPAAVGSQADAALRSGLAEGVPAGYELDPTTVLIGGADGVAGGPEGLMRISATAEARATLDEAERAQIKEAIAGKSVEDARAGALANGDVAELTIDISRTWVVDTLPSAGRIDLTTT